MAKKKPPATNKELEPTVQAFIKLLGSGAYEKNDREKFRDFCEAAYCAYAKLAVPPQEQADALEERYMRIVNSYKDKDYINTVWPRLNEFGERALGAPPTGSSRDDARDFLGVIAGEINALDDDQGQFFTPYGVSLMMAQINLDWDDIRTLIDRDGYITLAEPAVGAGGMVIAAADVLQYSLKRDPMISMLVQAWDINSLAYWMCFLQFCWRGITALVVRGDTLRMEVFEQAWTPFVHLFQATHGTLFDRETNAAQEPVPRTIETVLEEIIATNRAEITPEETPREVEPVTEPEPVITEPVEKAVQLTLF